MEGYRWQSSPDLGWDPEACWHCCARRPQSGSGRQPLEPRLPAVELSNYAGIGGPTNRLGTRENHFLHNLSCPISSLWGPLTSLCLSLLSVTNRIMQCIQKSEK